jgi:hypothetical protein
MKEMNIIVNNYLFKMSKSINQNRTTLLQIHQTNNKYNVKILTKKIKKLRINKIILIIHKINNNLRIIFANKNLLIIKI